MTTIPFSLFEEYMALDDSAEFPMDPAILLRFDGTLDARAAREAFEETLARHPLLTSVARRRRGKLFWVPTERRPEIVCKDCDAEPNVFNASGFPNVEPLDLFRAPGFRVSFLESKRENWTRVLIHFHHAVADGLGMMRVVAEWLLRYAQKMGVVEPSFRLEEIDREAFARRGKVGWTLKGYVKNYFNTWRTTLQYLVVFPRPLVSDATARGEIERERPRVRTLELSREATTAYFQRAKALGATVNDLALTDYFIALDRWLREAKGDDGQGVLRVMAPLNMRDESTNHISCANVVSTVFIDRTRRSLQRSRADSLKSMIDEMNWVKRCDQKYVFLLILRVLRCVPGSLRFFLNLPVCRASSVFTNLGRVFDDLPLPREDGKLKLGDATLERIESKAPIRRKTATSVAACTYAGRFCCSLCYDSRLLTEEDADAFLEILKNTMTNE